jgi:signal transduction histidine kinase
MPERNPFLTRLAQPIERALAGEDGTYTFEGDSGRERLAVFTPVDFAGAPWAVLVTSPSPATYGPNQDLLRNGLIAIGIAGALAIILALVLGEFTARPLRRLTTKADAIARGERSQPIEPSGAEEVLHLGQAFQKMEAQLTHHVADLEKGRRERERQAVELRDLHRRTVRLQEDERRRIAGEIHDAVSPLITGALYQARALRMSNGSTPPEERDEGLDAVADLLGQAGEELHGVIFELRPPDLDDLGVVPAIERYIQTIQRTGLTVHFDLIGEPPALTPEIRLGIYRIVQEALHNVVRHADADEAVVRFDASNDMLRVMVRDNGSGFDPARAQGPTSLGILSMRERAAAIGATFTIASRVGGGTVIVIERSGASLLVPEPESPGTPGVGVIDAQIVDTSPMNYSDDRTPHQEAPAVAGVDADVGVR